MAARSRPTESAGGAKTQRDRQGQLDTPSVGDAPHSPPLSGQKPGNRRVPPGGLLALRACILGEGHANFDAIMPLLAEQNPLGNELVLTLEVPADTIEASLAYARRAFAPYLND